MNRQLKKSLLVAACVAVAACSVSDRLAAADWLQFRGNRANSVAGSESLPTELSGRNMAWKVELPGRGLSGPIVVGDRVFVTASSGYTEGRLHVLSFDAATGKMQWERQFEATGRTGCHSKMCVATPTPASDGQRVFAFYSSNDLICTDLDGNLQWYRGLGEEFPNASNSLGMSSSPIVIGPTVIAQVESDAEAFAIGIDTVSGMTKWKIDRPRKANWTSPAILPGVDGRPTLALLQSSQGISAVDPETGKVMWEFNDGASTIPSATVVGGSVVIPSNGLTVVTPAVDGTVEEVWNASNLSPGTASPVVMDGMTFTVNSAGALAAGDVESGDRLWQLRLRGPFSSTPLASNGYLFFFNEDGFATVVKATKEAGEIVSELDLGETILCSPAAANNALYVRSDRHLYKFAE
jgi:outer membrane protein assembly factor BamB